MTKRELTPSEIARARGFVRHCVNVKASRGIEMPEEAQIAEFLWYTRQITAEECSYIQTKAYNKENPDFPLEEFKKYLEDHPV